MWGLHWLPIRARIQYNILQWRSEGGGICPRAPPGGGRQNPAKDLKKNLYKEKF